MSFMTHPRLALCVTLMLASLPVALGGRTQESGKFKTEVYTGKVQPLAKLLEKHGAKLDADAAEQWLALVADDGKVYPLVKDDGSRMFFKDAKLLDRPMRLTAHLVPELRVLQVVSVQSVIKGKLHEVYYWCDVCSIRTYEAGKCACCGAPVELKEVPVE
jgi:hypothetical protein